MEYPLRRLSIYDGAWGLLLLVPSFALGLLPTREIRIFSLACVAFAFAFVLHQGVNETSRLFLRSRPGWRRLVVESWVAPLLGIVVAYIAFKTPGTGVPEILTLVFFGLFFGVTSLRATVVIFLK